MQPNANKGFESKKLISATVPLNISEDDKKKLVAGWDEEARKRQEKIDLETKIPTKPSHIFKYELHRFGHQWNGFIVDKKGKRIPLLNAPSLLTSALDAIADDMREAAVKS